MIKVTAKVIKRTGRVAKRQEKVMKVTEFGDKTELASDRDFVTFFHFSKSDNLQTGRCYECRCNSNGVEQFSLCTKVRPFGFCARIMIR